MAFLRTLAALICVSLVFAAGTSAAPSEHQVKAVFLFNFSRFVEWPPSAFSSADAPFVIGVYGRDPFGSDLDEVVRGESVNGRRLVVRRMQTVAETAGCHILFIPESERAQLGEILKVLKERSTLIVSDVDGVSRPGAMIRLVTQNDRIKLRIDAEATRAAGLIVSSKLLRASEIIGPAPGGA